MGTQQDVVVIGLGSAGLTAASVARRFGASVTAAERARIGGDCLWTGCVPSKALLAAAKLAHAMRHADVLGLTPVQPDVDTARVLARVREVQVSIAATDDSPDALRAKGVTLVEGAARIASPSAVEVEGHGTIRCKHVVVCTGSRAAIPDLPGLAEAGVLTPESFWDQERLPASLLVLGGGPVGVELAQACARLGVRVTLLERGPRLLARDEPALAERLTARLRADGVEVVLGAAVDGARRDGVEVELRAGARTWRAAAVLAAAGRRANVEGLGLDGVGVEHGPDGIAAEGGGRTSVPGIWAAGDVVAGAPRFTHSAGFEAARVVRNVLFPGTEAKPYVVPWTTFTDPELAHVGLTEAEARERFGDRRVRVWRHELAHSDRARADGHDDGEVRIVTAKGRVVGAHVLAPAAGEVVHELALAVHLRRRLTDLAAVVHVYPTLTLAVQQLAAEAVYAKVRPLRFLARA